MSYEPGALAAKDTTRDGDADEPAHADGPSAENEAAESSTTEGSQGPRAKVWLALVVIAIFEMWLFGFKFMTIVLLLGVIELACHNKSLFSVSLCIELNEHSGI